MITNKRPYVFLCTGVSIDGKISTFERRQTEIATNDNKDILYDGRVKADAVMVGGRTLILDDPGLTVKSDARAQERIKNGKTPEPMKVAVISNANNLKTDGAFFTRGDGEKVIFTAKLTSDEKIKELKKYCKVYVFGEERVDLSTALAKLSELGVNSLMVEGGGELNYSLIKNNFVDEINLKVGNRIIGGRTAPTLCDGEGFSLEEIKNFKIVSVTPSDNSVIIKYVSNI